MITEIRFSWISVGSLIKLLKSLFCLKSFKIANECCSTISREPASLESSNKANEYLQLLFKIDEDDVLESVQKDNIESNIQDKSETKKKLEVKDQSNEEDQKEPDNKKKSDENDNVVEKEEK